MRIWDRLVHSEWNYRIAFVGDLLAPLGWLAYSLPRYSGSAAGFGGLAVAGFLGFGGLEYAVHRWLLHGPFPALRRSHARHHAEPLALYGAPLFLVMAVSLVTWSLLDLLMPSAPAAIVVFGLYLGYDYFAVLHHLQHHAAGGLAHVGPWHRLEQFHTYHHHHSGVNFGITTMFWDRLFGTFDRRTPRGP